MSQRQTKTFILQVPCALDLPHLPSDRNTMDCSGSAVLEVLSPQYVLILAFDCKAARRCFGGVH